MQSVLMKGFIVLLYILRIPLGLREAWTTPLTAPISYM